MKTIVVRIARDGSISAETHGLTGPACLPYIRTLEAVLEAETVDSHLTADYYASELEGTAESSTAEHRYGAT